MQNLKELLQLLLKNKTDFVLVGGFASVVHGSIAVTQDLDICMAITSESIDQLRATLSEVAPVHRMNPNFQPSFLNYPEDLAGVKNIYLKTKLGVLDILSELPPAGDFDEIKKRSIAVDLYNYQCRVISLEDLIEIKKSMGRAKDKEVLEQLLKIKELRLNPK